MKEVPFRWLSRSLLWTILFETIGPYIWVIYNLEKLTSANGNYNLWGKREDHHILCDHATLISLLCLQISKSYDRFWKHLKSSELYQVSWVLKIILNTQTQKIGLQISANHWNADQDTTPIPGGPKTDFFPIRSEMDISYKFECVAYLHLTIYWHIRGFFLFLTCQKASYYQIPLYSACQKASSWCTKRRKRDPVGWKVKLESYPSVNIGFCVYAGNWMGEA